MKRFKFSLEGVQTVRERAARTALEDYAKALRARLEAEANLEKADRNLTQHLADWRAKMNKGFSPGDMLQNEHMQSMLEIRRNEFAKLLRASAEAVNKAHSTFQLARRKSDVVERFHERQRNDFNLAVLKDEQNTLDELASSRHGRDYFQEGVTHA